MASLARPVVRVEVGHWYRPVAFGLTVVLLVFAALRLYSTATGAFGRFLGWDFGHYVDATRRWVETGTPYLAHEVAASFTRFDDLTFLHPPIALPLFAPFLVLPAILWWVIPWTVIGLCVASWRPAPWTWPLMAFALAWPRFGGAFIVGNTDMWVMAFLALGLRLGWPWALVLVKPTYAVLGLLALRDRRAWIGGALFLAACIPFGALWADWIAVTLHAPASWTYSIPNLPTILLPVYAWAGRQPPRM